MKIPTLVRLALAGTRTDLLRVLLTAFSAALATLVILAALTVLAITTPLPTEDNQQSWSLQYGNALLREPGLRGGTAFVLMMLTIPVLALAGQCARLGAPARDRRLAAIRLAGATPGQAVRIAAAEAGIASLLGAVVALGVYFVGRQLLGAPGPDGKLALPTDVLPQPGVLAGVVVGLPLLATLATAVMLRRVTITPFGVVRKAGRKRSPLPWPGVLIAFGVAAFVSFQPLMEWYGRNDKVPPVWLLPVLFGGGGLLAMIGVILGAGWLSYTSGRLLHRYARRPAALLAARRLTADPWAGSRTFAALLAALIFGAGAVGVRAYFVAERKVRMEYTRASAGTVTDPAGDFYVQTMDLVNLAVVVALVIAAGGLLVAVAEGVVSRRRSYAALVATGVPRRTLGGSVAWQSLAPALPAILLALTVGTMLGRGLVGDEATAGGGMSGECVASAEVCANPATAEQHIRWEQEPTFTQAIAVPFDDLALYGGGALVAILVTVGVGLLFLRASTSLEELRAG